MPRTTPVTPALSSLFREQDGLASYPQLSAHGFSANAVQHRVSTGAWSRPLPGVVLTQPGEPSRRQRLLAAKLWAGADAVIDAADACAWYGIRPAWFRPSQVHIVVPFDSPLRSRGFVVVRRAIATTVIAEHGLVPYVDAATAVIVAAREARSVGDAIAWLALVLQRGLVTVTDLQQARERLGDKWCRRVDLPEPLWNQWLDLGDGLWPICADALWEEAATMQEVLGRKYHAWGEQFESTEARRARAVAAGLAVQGATARQIRQGAALLDRLERTYLRYAGRGLPTGVRLLDRPAIAVSLP